MRVRDFKLCTMDECFNFESKYRTTPEVKMLDVKTADGTEWKITEEWLTSKTKARIFMQRLVFTKENCYARHYIINIEITSVTNHASGKIKVTARTKPVSTKIIVTLGQFKVFRYSVSKSCKVHDIQISDRVLGDDFRYKVTIRRAYVLEDKDGTTRVPPRDKLMIFSDQMRSLLESGNFSDVVLTDGHSQLRAHRNILSARSIYFRNMFTHEMRESRDGVVYIPDVNVEVLKEMLSFMYSGVLKAVDVQTAQDLFKAADKYEVGELKRLCCEVMERHVSVDNAVGILLLAHSHHERDLEDFSLDFVLKNFSFVSETDGWNALKENCPDLAMEVTSRYEVMYEIDG